MVQKSREKDLSKVILCNPNFSLKNQFLDNKLLKKEPRKSVHQNTGAREFRAEDFSFVLKAHHCSNDSMWCRVLLQLALGSRFQNVGCLKKFSKLLNPSKLCQCSKFGTCDVISDSCLYNISFSYSKTTPFTTYLSPQLLPCYLNICRFDFEIDSKVMTKFLKTNVHPTYSSHSLRKFLPNLVASKGEELNTGNWSQKSSQISSTLVRHYLSSSTQYPILAAHINQIKTEKIFRTPSSSSCAVFHT